MVQCRVESCTATITLRDVVWQDTPRKSPCTFSSPVSTLSPKCEESTIHEKLTATTSDWGSTTRKDHHCSSCDLVGAPLCSSQLVVPPMHTLERIPEVCLRGRQQLRN